MIINNDNNGKPTGFIETLISNDRVVTINATRQTGSYRHHTRPDQWEGENRDFLRNVAFYTEEPTSCQ